MSDDLVKRLRAGSESLNMPPSVQSIKNIRCMDAMDEAAAALVAKDAEIARLRDALVKIIAETDNSGIEFASVGMRVAERVEEIARAALNTQYKGETP